MLISIEYGDHSGVQCTLMTREKKVTHIYIVFE